MIIACITRYGVDDPYTHVLCYDGERVLEIRPRDPHVPGWDTHDDGYDELFRVYPDVQLIGPENWYLTIADDIKQSQETAFEIWYIHTGKYEALYRVRAKTHSEAYDLVQEHHLELDPVQVVPLSDDYERYL